LSKMHLFNTHGGCHALQESQFFFVNMPNIGAIG